MREFHTKRVIGCCCWKCVRRGSSTVKQYYKKLKSGNVRRMFKDFVKKEQKDYGP
jgi:hypothetical protein